MSKIYDVGIIGLGGHGTATAHHAASRGLSVLGLERFQLGHEMGSSHGTHRLFRLAYAEGHHYLPLLLRAAELWEEAERLTGERLFVRNGVLIASTEQEGSVQRAAASAGRHGIPYELMEAAEVNRRFPAFKLRSNFVGLLQPQSGFVMSERAILAHAQSAESNGATLVCGAQVTGWEHKGGEIEIKTATDTFRCRKLVVSAGAWVGTLVPSIAHVNTVGRRVIGYFEPRRPADFTPQRCPGFSFKSAELGIYGFPIFGARGVKIGRNGHLRETGDPETLSRVVTPRDEAALREGLAAFLNEVDGEALVMKACRVTETPDEDFILDWLPDQPNVHIVSACSGHGFKLASAVGEIVADRVEGRPDRFDLSRFRLSRFKAGTGAAA